MDYSIDEIVAGCKKYKRKYQALLYQLFADQLHNAALRYASDPSKRRDHVHDAFIKIYTRIDEYNGENLQIYRWMLRILINEILQKKRREKKIEYVDEFEEHGSDSEVEPIIQKMTYDEIWLLIKSMEYKDQVILNLSLVDDLNHSEIAEILDVSIQNSRTKLSRAKANLRLLISKQEAIKNEIT